MSKISIADLTNIPSINKNAYIELYVNMSTSNNVSTNITYQELKSYLEDIYTGTSHNILDIFFKASYEKTFENGAWPLYADDLSKPNWVNNGNPIEHTFSFDYIVGLKTQGLIKAQYVNSTDNEEINRSTYMLELNTYGYTSSFLIDVNRKVIAAPILNSSYIRSVTNTDTLNTLSFGVIQKNVLKAHTHLYNLSNYFSYYGNRWWWHRYDVYGLGYMPYYTYGTRWGWGWKYLPKVNTISILTNYKNIRSSYMYNRYFLYKPVNEPVYVTSDKTFSTEGIGDINYPKTIEFIPYIQILSKISDTTQSVYNANTNNIIQDYIKKLGVLPIGTIISLPKSLNTSKIIGFSDSWVVHDDYYIKGANSDIDAGTTVNYYNTPIENNNIYKFFDHYHGSGSGLYAIISNWNSPSPTDGLSYITKITCASSAKADGTLYCKQGNRATSNIISNYPTASNFSYVPPSYNITFYKKIK